MPTCTRRPRGLLAKLITPKRLSENEEFMWRLADQQLDTFIAKGPCEFMEDYAKPFAMLVIADLLGVPLEDHAEFRRVLGNEVVGEVGAEETITHNPLQWLDDKFRELHHRPASRTARGCPDRARGRDVPRRFGARGGGGRQAGDVPVRRGYGDDDEIAQHRHAGDGRAARHSTVATGQPKRRFPVFLEEALRTESPVKSHFRLG